MKKLFLAVAFVTAMVSANAQTVKETFDSNSLEWTETAYKNGVGTAVIEKGKMTVTSKGERAGLSLLTGNKADAKAATFFETHCYAPIYPMKPFEISAMVNVKSFTEENLAGFVFNYRDGGNFYAFSFNENFVVFERYVDGRIVGTIQQGIKWGKKRNANMNWTLVSDGQTLSFKVDDVKMMNIRYMPLEYNGFGFYTFGKQELSVDEVTFKQ